MPSGLSVEITESSFEELFKGHFRELAAYAFAMLNDQVMAEEVVQQVFYQIWEKRETVVFDTSVKAYLYKSVYHRCLNYRKHQKIRQEHARQVLWQKQEAQPEATGISNKEMVSQIQSAIDSLPEQCRLIFQMSRFEELKYREIADRLEISVKTVEAQMGKALKQLRVLLGNYLTTISATLIYILNNLN